LTADGLDRERRRSLQEITELFDHRLDGVAAMRRFRAQVRWHLTVFGDGTAGTGEAQIIGDLTREERRIQRQREHREQLTRGGSS
jgi:hypothetical protein